MANKWYRSLWFLVLFNLALFILLAEIALRIKGDYKSYGERTNGMFIDYFKPPYKGPLCAWTADSTVIQIAKEFTYEVTTNSLGIRDVEHTIIKPAGAKRLLVLGDSFTEGVGVPFDSTWHQRMAWYLQTDGINQQWEIVVGAVSGCDPFYSYEMLRRQFFAYQPDVVIQVYNHTDINDYALRGGLERFINDSVTQWRPVNQVLHTAFKWSHLMRFLVKEVLQYNDYYQSAGEYDRLQMEAIPKYKELFAKIDSLSQAVGAEALFIFQPMGYELQQGYYEPHADSLMEYMEVNGLHYVRLMDILPSEMKYNMKGYFWPIDGHMNDRGYNAWGEAMYKYFKASGTLNNNN